LRNLKTDDRRSLQGDYLFIIDSKPRFIVLVDESGAWSVSLNQGETLTFEVETGCPIPLNLQTIENSLHFTARTKITTDSITLQKLLHGKMKAKIAFLSGKVSFSGDLPAFLKMVSLLKRNGVKPRPGQSIHAKNQPEGKREESNF
jgi:hypothetical protein